MPEEQLRHLTQQGIQAVQAACKMGQEATSKIEGMVTAPELKELLKKGNEHSRQMLSHISHHGQVGNIAKGWRRLRRHGQGGSARST